MIYAFDHNYNKTDAYEAIDGRPYFCPVCKNPMFMRRGRNKVWHFAHYRGTKCNYIKRIPISHIKKEDIQEIVEQQ